MTVDTTTVESANNFTVDNTAPSISSTVPTDDSTDASPAIFQILFDENIALGSGDILIKKAADDTVVETIPVAGGRVSVSGQRLMIKPTAFLDYATSYYIEVPAGAVVDSVGNSFSSAILGNSAWNFTTRPAPSIVITQFYEGTSNNKYLEIANISGSSVSLADYTITTWSDGNAEAWKSFTSVTPSYTYSWAGANAVTLAPGQVYVIANSSATTPLPPANANLTSTVTFFTGNDSIVLFKGATGDPANVVDAVPLTNSGNEGLDKTLVRISTAPGFNLDAGSSATSAGFSAVWQSVDLTTANAALPGTNEYLGSTTLVTPPAQLSFSAGTVSVNEDAGSLTLTVLLSADITDAVSAEIVFDVTSTGSAADFGDYTTQTVTFAAGSTAGSSQTVTVTITDDALEEGAETGIFKLQNISGALAGAPLTSTVTIRASDKAVPNLLISEVADPSNLANGRFVEIYNPGSTTVDLTAEAWNLVRFSNAGTTPTAIPLAGTIAAGGRFVVAFSSDDFTSGFPSAPAPQQISTQVNGNGDDVYALYYGGDSTTGTLRDIYGLVGNNGVGTWDYTDKRAVRKSAITAPNAVWTADEWVIGTAATTKFNPGIHPDTAPVVSGTLTASGMVGQAFTYQITADNNATIFSCGALPSGLIFNATTGAITGTLVTAVSDLSITIGATNGGGTDEDTLVLSVAKGTPTIAAAPTASAINQGQALSASTLTGGSATGIGANVLAGGFAWTTGTTIPPAGTTSYSVTFTPTDADNWNTVTANVSVTVNSVNSAPTDIGLTATSIAENNAVNANVGTLSTTDADAGDTFTYSLVAGTGSTDNSSFNISGTSLRASAAFDFETKSSYSIRVRTTDSAGAIFEKQFTITVTDVNEGTTFAGWSGGAPLNAANVGKYAIGGASSLSATDGVAPTSTVSGGNLVLTAIVRTDDTNLTVVGEAVTSLADYTNAPSITTVNGSTNGVSQAGLPNGHQRQAFSVPQASDARKFLRLKATLAQ